jgi:hypothetical protein
MNDRSGREDELYALLGELCNDTLTPERLARLEGLLRCDSAAQDFYWNYMSLHSELSWRESASAALTERAAEIGSPDDPPAAPGHMGSPVLGFLHGLPHVSFQDFMTAAAAWFAMAVLCSGIAITAVILVLAVVRREGAPAPEVAQSRTQEPLRGDREPTDSSRGFKAISSAARLVRMAECRWAPDSRPPALGEDLAPGRKLVLLSGLAEVMFQTGVRTVLQGPATMEIDTRSSTRLGEGKLTVRVENAAGRGFVVRAPGMKYTDLGTEFGLWVQNGGQQEVHVFRGQVRAEPISEPGESSGEKGNRGAASVPSALHPVTLVLTAQQAMRIAAPGKPVERIVANEKRFHRTIPQPEPFSVFSTGAALDRGEPDPHWTITANTADAKFTPRSAVVAEPLSAYGPLPRDKGQWISLGDPLPTEPAGCRLTYCTHFNLAGFDHSKARIEGRITADDFIAEIRLNGRPVPVPPGSRAQWLYQRWLPLKIEGGFIAGDNTLELVIENGPELGPGLQNAVALCAELNGTAPKLMTADKSN